MSLSPHGGRLVQVRAIEGSKEKELVENSIVQVSHETMIQMFNISTGILSPLTGFMGKSDYENVIENMRLADDTPWTIPVLLHVPDDFNAGTNDEITLVDDGGRVVGLLEFGELFSISKKEYAKKVFGTEDEAHPGVAKTYASSDRVVGGKLKSVVKFDNGPFGNFTLSPKETRGTLQRKGMEGHHSVSNEECAPHRTRIRTKDGSRFCRWNFYKSRLGEEKSWRFY